MKENDTLMVVSDKASMLNDIPAMCRLIMCELLKIFKTSDLMIFLIKNKKWA
jgi:TusA-related sulfurtransferase